MSLYTRLYQPGGYYFFTLATYQRQLLFSDLQNIQHLKAAMQKVKKEYPFSLNAIVILPDHLHCIWKLPGNDVDFPTRWRLIKRYFSMQIDTSVSHRKEKEIWQRRFWEHVIRDEYDWRKHMDYIHYNPVRHGYVKSPCDWEYSSFHYWVRRGVYEKSWSSGFFSGMEDAE